MKIKSLFLWLAALCIALVAGCGGGGASGGGGGALSLFLTDNLSSYDAVWVKIYQVDLRTATGTTTVFQDANGLTINLRTLRDASGARFTLLASRSVSPGRYVGADVFMDPSLVVFTGGATTGANKTFPASITTGGRAKVQTTLDDDLGSGRDNLILDFDLSQWTESPVGTINPVIRKVTDPTVGNPARHENEDYKGTISALNGTAPAQTFTLTGRHGTFSVSTSSSTVIFRSNGQPSPTLANGQSVKVRGTFNTTTNVLEATSVKIEDGAGQDNPEVRGAPSALNAGAGTFTITTGQCGGFLPSNSTVNIVTTGSTIFRLRGGVTTTSTDWYAQAATATLVEAEGTYNAGTNTLTATKVKIEDGQGGGNGGDAEAKGSASNLNAEAKTFTLGLSEWEGFNATLGQSITVNTSNAQYKNGSNQTVNAATWYFALSSAPAGTRVKVEGSFADGVFTAREAKILPPIS
jgi:hypothetical protein